VSRWEQAQVFDRDGACEDARLQALADYDASVRAVDRRHQGRERHALNHLFVPGLGTSWRLFGRRCVNSSTVGQNRHRIAISARRAVGPCQLATVPCARPRRSLGAPRPQASDFVLRPRAMKRRILMWG